RHHARRAVRSLSLVPWPRGDHADAFGLPGRRVLQPASGRAGRTVGRTGLALGPGALAHPVRAAGRQLPRRGRRRYLRVPRSARSGLTVAEGQLTGDLVTAGPAYGIVNSSFTAPCGEPWGNTPQ